MASYNQKVKRKRAKKERRFWKKRMQERLIEFYHKPKWWRKIKAVNHLYRSLEEEVEKSD